jgi:hypothetical protein
MSIADHARRLLMELGALAVQRDITLESRASDERYSRLRLFWGGVWTGVLAATVVLMVAGSGCRREQPPSPQAQHSNLNSVIFLNRHWVESDAARIMEGVQEI